MKKIFIKVLSVLIFSVVFNSMLAAAEATVTYVSGKVEVNRNNEWKKLAVGDAVYEGEVISTGFESEARIKYNGSVLSLSSLTRVTLEQMSSNKNSDNVNVYLNTGAVRSKVNRTENTRAVSYTVHTPVAVASVRGTEFIVTGKGKVICYEGAVAVYSAKQYKKNVETTTEESEIDEVEETNVAEVTETVTGSVTEAPAESTEAAAEVPSSSVASSDNTASDYVPATSTTPAKEIANDSPAGAIVVAQNQQTVVSKAGVTEKPQDTASKNITKVKNAVSTAAQKDIVSSNTSVMEGVPATVSNPVADKGKIYISVQFE